MAVISPSGTTNLSTFPSTSSEALAFLYVQSRDLSDKSPEDLAEIYKNAHDRIKAKRKEMSKN